VPEEPCLFMFLPGIVSVFIGNMNSDNPSKNKYELQFFTIPCAHLALFVTSRSQIRWGCLAHYCSYKRIDRHNLGQVRFLMVLDVE